MNALLRQINATTRTEKMSEEKPLHMRPFPYVCSCLAVLLITSSCGKSSIDGSLTGKWKLISYSGGPTYPSSEVGEILTLRTAHIYEIRYNDSLTSSGIYRVGHPSYAPKPVLYFSKQDNYGSMISFDKDTLVLAYAGVTVTLYSPTVCRFVKVH
jgi:hypothetical protein